MKYILSKCTNEVHEYVHTS